jgi:hypothetical protein
MPEQQGTAPMPERLKVQYIPIEKLIPYARNSRTHSDAQVAQIAASIREFGWTNPVLVDGEGGIIAGHGRVMAARKLGLSDLPTINLSHMTETQRRAYVIADNQLALNAGWDSDLLSLELANLKDDGFDLDLLGFDDLDALLGEQDGNAGSESMDGNLSDRFMIPPFTVLNAREGWWQDRKRAWLALGIKSEEGRGEDGGGNQTGGVLMKSWSSHPDFYNQKTAKEKELGRDLTAAEFLADYFVIPGGALASGTSVFDPVLCELSYAWFSPVGGTVLDPFAGGSVRGVVASKMGRQYIGHELRQEQVDANRIQGGEICGDDAHPPAWICGDSRNIDSTCKDVDADMVFTCPPYADLEVYSDDPKDLSTLGYNEFRGAYFEIIRKACARLKNDRFAVCVVGDVRDKKGNYYDFVGDTVQAFRDAGLHYYNEAILVTSVGSVAMRVGKQFTASRKLGKSHQNVLVFVKGDGKRAAQACGEVNVDDALAGVVPGEIGGEAPHALDGVTV